VYRFLRYFTFLPVAEIERIEAEDAERQGRPEAQGVLAREVTRLVHGDEGLAAAERITQALFSGDLADLSESDYAQLSQDGLPSMNLQASYGEKLAETPLTTVLVDAGMANSGKQIKDALQRNAVVVNGTAYGVEDNMKAAEIFAGEQSVFDTYFMVKVGKKKHCLLTV